MCLCVQKLHVPVPQWCEDGRGACFSTSLQSGVINVMVQEGGGIWNSGLFGGDSLTKFMLLKTARPGCELDCCTADKAYSLIISKVFWRGFGSCYLGLSYIIPRDCLRNNVPGTSPCMQYEHHSTRFGCLCSAARTLLAFASSEGMPLINMLACARQTQVSFYENTALCCSSALSVFEMLLTGGEPTDYDFLGTPHGTWRRSTVKCFGVQMCRLLRHLALEPQSSLWVVCLHLLFCQQKLSGPFCW